MWSTAGVSDPSVGVVFRPQSPPEQLREVVRRAEDAGVDELWLWEDCFLDGGLATATAALAWTGRLAVGVGLLPVPLRNPALAAMEIAALARMFPGRFRPGLGHGEARWMAQVGAGVASPMTLLGEYTTAVRSLLAGETVTAQGRYVRLDAVALDRAPEGPPPVLVGGRGPKTLRLAGELADGVILDSGLTLDRVRESVASAQEGRTAAGRSAEPFHVVAYYELDPAAPDLAAQVADRTAELGAAGVTSVVFQGTAGDPDPTPLIEALRGRA
jgi:alkanesulfonate monooxygenase SsuD/methylene tetrahydromethanopterin reductase-like flavin-dependent oxidoreductase (luciferase family)